MARLGLVSLRVAASIGLVACESSQAPSAIGRLEVAPVPPVMACGAAQLSRVQVRGPTDATVTVAPGTTALIENLQPGTYAVGVEYLIGGEVDCFGQSLGLVVVAGQTTQTSVGLAPFASTVTQLLPSPGTKSFTASFAGIAGAVSYEVEAATDPAFTANHVVQTSTQTSAVITVPTSGPYLVRVRAIDPYQGRGRPSGSQAVTVTCDCWTAKASMPTPRANLAVGVVNGVLYAVGGSDNNGVLSTVEAYDPVANTWMTKAPLPTPREALAVGVTNGVLYAVGGLNGDPNSPGSHLSTVEAYDPVTNTWTTKAPMPTARSFLAIGVVSGALYVTGGHSCCTGSSDLSIVEVYDPGTNTWATRADMPTERSSLAAEVVNGVLYAIGGYNYDPASGSGEAYSSIVQAYEPLGDRWTLKANMQTGRTDLAAGVVTGVLYAVGGYNDSNLSMVEAYDLATNTWTTRAPMPTARSGLAVGVVNRVLYAIGGFNGTELSAVSAYEP